MDIHILTQDSASKEQLSSLLVEMEFRFTIHEEVEPLLRAVKKLKKTDIVLYDLSLENRLWAFERLHTSCRRTSLVGFELLTKETSEGGQHCVQGMGHYLLLPKNHDRAKARMLEVFKEVALAAVPKKRKSKSRKHSRPKKKAQSTGNESAVGNQAESRELCLTTTRYLQVQSLSMQTFLTRLHAAVGANRLVLIEGEEGAEFELVAREFNYHANGDISPLLVMDPTHLNFDALRQLEREAAGREEIQNCYLGMSAELNRSSADALSEFMDHLLALADPCLRIVLGHAIDSESYCCENARSLMRRFREHANLLEFPALSERSGDIPLIAQKVFSNMRMAHPFLRARTLSREAIEYLQAECEGFDYAKLVRVLRNAMALGENETLSVKELKNLDDNNPISQHLVESLADEKYFPTEESGAA